MSQLTAREPKRRDMRTRRALLTLLVLAAGYAVPAQAQPGSHCTAEFDLTLSPGIGSEPSSGVFHSRGETGTITCDNGRRGKVVSVDGRYGTKDPDTCLAGGEGWMVQSFAISDDNIRNTATFVVGGLSGGFLNGRFDGERFSGKFSLTPTKGDCVTGPITEGTVTLDGTLSG